MLGKRIEAIIDAVEAGVDADDEMAIADNAEFVTPQPPPIETLLCQHCLSDLLEANLC